MVEAADAAEGLLSSISANGATCAKAQTLAAARNCVRTIDRLEEQVVQQYRLINRFAARTPIFSLAPAEGRSRAVIWPCDSDISRAGRRLRTANASSVSKESSRG